MYFSLFKETKNFDFYCMFFSAVCVAQGYHITGRGLLKWRLRKLLFDAKIQFLAKEKGEFTTKLAILANRC